MRMILDQAAAKIETELVGEPEVAFVKVADFAEY